MKNLEYRIDNLEEWMDRIERYKRASKLPEDKKDTVLVEPVPCVGLICGDTDLTGRFIEW